MATMKKSAIEPVFRMPPVTMTPPAQSKPTPSQNDALRESSEDSPFASLKKTPPFYAGPQTKTRKIKPNTQRVMEILKAQYRGR